MFPAAPDLACSCYAAKVHSGIGGSLSNSLWEKAFEKADLWGGKLRTGRRGWFGGAAWATPLRYPHASLLGQLSFNFQ
jgi:hypothetical protein